MDFLAGQNATILALFRQQGQPVVPTSATYTLYDTDGSVLLADQSISLGPTSSQASIVVSSSYNNISTDFEKRTILVTYIYQGRTYIDRYTYRLTGFLNHVVTPAAVRNYLGVNLQELPDDHVDITDAYFQIQKVLTKATLEAALAAGDDKERNANKAILYQTAINIIPSLQLRVAQQETDGPIGFHRATIKDFRELLATTQSLLSDCIALISNAATSAFPLVVLTLPTDPITGA